MAIRPGVSEVEKRKQFFKDQGIDESLILNPEPGKHYKPVNVKRIDHWRMRGFEIVPAKSKTRYLGAHTSSEGGQQNGDLVLMETPIENRHARVRRAREKQKWHERSYMESAKEEINRIARDGGAVGAHKSVAIDDSYEGEESDREKREAS